MTETQPILVAPKRVARPARSAAKAPAPTAPQAQWASDRVAVTFKTHRSYDIANGACEMFVCSSKDWGNDEDVYLEVCTAEHAAALAAQERQHSTFGSAGAMRQTASFTSVDEASTTAPSTPASGCSQGRNAGAQQQQRATGPGPLPRGGPPAPNKGEGHSVWVCRATPRSDCSSNTLSVDDELVSGTKRLMSLIRHKSAAKAISFAEVRDKYSLDHIELSFRDAFLSRSDMLLVERYMRNRVVFIGQSMEYEGHSFVISRMTRTQSTPSTFGGDRPSLAATMTSTGESGPTNATGFLSPFASGSTTPASASPLVATFPAHSGGSGTGGGNANQSKELDVLNGIVGEQTIVSFESVSFVQTIIILLSQEMWMLTPDGRIALDWTLDAFLPQLTEQFHRQRTSPIIRVMYVGRIATKGQDFVHSFFLSRKSANVDELPNEARSQMTVLMRALSKHVDISHPVHTFTAAIDANFLETVNLVIERYSFHQVDRRLNLTGQRMTVITAGKGIFRVSNELAQLTAMRMMDNSLQRCTIVCIGRPPLHRAPLLEYHGSDKGLQMQRSLKLERNRFYYEEPRWAHCLFFCPMAMVTDRTPIFELLTQAQWESRFGASSPSATFHAGVALPPAEHAQIELLEVARRRREVYRSRKQEKAKRRSLDCNGDAARFATAQAARATGTAATAEIFSRVAPAVLQGSRCSSATILTQGAGSMRDVGALRSKPGTSCFMTATAAPVSCSSLSLSHADFGSSRWGQQTSAATNTNEAPGVEPPDDAPGGRHPHALRRSLFTTVGGGNSLGGLPRVLRGASWDSDAHGQRGGAMRCRSFKGIVPPFVHAAWFVAIAEAGVRDRSTHPTAAQERLLPLGEFILDSDIKGGQLVLQLSLSDAGSLEEHECMSDLIMTWKPEIATDPALFSTLKACFRTEGTATIANDFASSLALPQAADVHPRHLILRQKSGCSSVRIVAEETLRFDYNAHLINTHTMQRVRMGGSKTGDPADHTQTPRTAEATVTALKEDYALDPTIAVIVPSFNVLFGMQPIDPFPRAPSSAEDATATAVQLRTQGSRNGGAMAATWCGQVKAPEIGNNWASLCRCPLIPLACSGADSPALTSDKDAFHDNPHTVPANRQVSFMELVLQRLHQGYRLVSLSDNEAFLTLWHQHQRLKRNPDGSISVIRSLHRGVYSVEVNGVPYSYFQWNYFMQDFEHQQTFFASQLGPRGAFPWSELDQCLAEGEFCCDRDEFKGRVLMFAIIPTSDTLSVDHASFDAFLGSRFSKYLVPKVTSGECVWGHDERELTFVCRAQPSDPEPLFPVRLEQPEALAVRDNDIDTATGKRLKQLPPVARVQHVEVSLTRAHNPRCVFYINLAWLVCSAPLVSDWIKSLQHTAPKYNLRVVGVPCRYDITHTNRLKSVYRISGATMALREKLLRHCVVSLKYLPDTPEVGTHCRLIHHTAKSFIVSLPHEIQWGENFMVETGSQAQVEQWHEFVAAYEQLDREERATADCEESPDEECAAEHGPHTPRAQVTDEEAAYVMAHAGSEPPRLAPLDQEPLRPSIVTPLDDQLASPARFRHDSSPGDGQHAPPFHSRSESTMLREDTQLW